MAIGHYHEVKIDVAKGQLINQHNATQTYSTKTTFTNLLLFYHKPRWIKPKQLISVVHQQYAEHRFIS